MNTLDAIMTRRSTRKFTDQPIEEEKLHTLLEAAMAAPSCVHSSDWQFIVVTEREVLDKMQLANGPAATPLKQATAAILVCGDLDRSFKGEKDYWIIDSAIVAENICIAAQELGLGSVYLGTYPQMERVNAQKELFHLPENIMPHSIIALGYPTSDITTPREDRYDVNKVHFNKW